jgi:hypothetical protein
VGSTFVELAGQLLLRWVSLSCSLAQMTLGKRPSYGLRAAKLRGAACICLLGVYGFWIPSSRSITSRYPTTEAAEEQWLSGRCLAELIQSGQFIAHPRHYWLRHLLGFALLFILSIQNMKRCLSGSCRIVFSESPPRKQLRAALWCVPDRAK